MKKLSNKTASTTNGRLQVALSSVSMAIACYFVLFTNIARAAGPNILVNGDFETPVAASAANNIPGTVTPWVVGMGQQPNVVKVRADGTYHYKAGPWRDASGVGGTGTRQYLDITNGNNDIYQSFTPPCDGRVNFGGFFSSRSTDDGTSYAGSGYVKIVQGVGISGTPIGTSLTANLPAGHNAHTDPWTPVNGSATVGGGTTYSYVVHMDNDVNFDEAYVTYEIECNSTPTPTPTPTPAISPTPTPTPTVIPGCAQVTGEARCLGNGDYTYTFNVTNNSGTPASQILLTPAQGSTFTLTSQLTNLSSPLQNGQSAPGATTIGNVKPGDKVCFFVSLMSETTKCCIVQVCPTLPRCGEVSPAPTVTSSLPPTRRQPPRQRRRR